MEVEQNTGLTLLCQSRGKDGFQPAGCSSADRRAFAQVCDEHADGRDFASDDESDDEADDESEEHGGIPCLSVVFLCRTTKVRL